MKRTQGLGLLVLAALVAAPWTAWACGGMFCANNDGTPRPPAPVDQNAERIIFVVHEDGDIEAHVQIQYTGAPEDFAWVVPLPSVPEVDDSDEEHFTALDEATRLNVRLPPSLPCPVPNSSSSAMACGPFSASDSAGAPAGEAQNGKSVTVYAHDRTANYEYHVVGAKETAALVEWLQENSYNVSDNMTPVMDPYNGPDARFIALKLRADRDASAIAPVKMRYKADHPGIPIQLTAVAAQPLMGILVYIIADKPYRPSNYAWAKPDPAEILFDTDSSTSYFEWVAREVDENDGRLFIVESSLHWPDGSPAGNIGYGESAWITRLYTRLSPHHMTTDPVFVPSDDPADESVVNDLDLTAAPTLYDCRTVIEERVPSPCAFNYCGAGAECAVVDGRIGCRCASGEVAQTINGPDGEPRVTCSPRVNELGVTAEAGGAGTEFDPCRSTDCGAGTCELKGGFPTCECDAGAFACLEPDGSVLCVEAPADTLTFGPGAGPESAGRRDAVLRAPLRRETDASPLGPFGVALVVYVVCARRRRSTPPRT